MHKTPRFSALLSLVMTFVVGTGFAHAQTSPVAVRSSRAAGVTVAPGGVVTAPFTIRNATSDSVAITQSIVLPAGWLTVNSLAPAMLGAGALELWLVSIKAPAGATAGSYVLRAGVDANGWTASDSVVVTVEERYALDVKATSVPTYVLAGDSYETVFLVRNAGNVATRVTLKATSNRGSSPKLSATQIDLTPGATQPVKVTVAVPAAGSRSQQDLLELIAIDAARDSVRGTTSVETTIIARASAGADFWTIPGDVAFRAATAGSGVSRFVASGSGRISEKSDATVDFAIQTAPAGQSAFGERDQYRLGLRTEHASLRAGDNSFGFSTLTSSGSQGMGAELTGKHGGLVAGGYLQKSRWLPAAGTEMAAMLGTSEEKLTGASMVVLQRGNPAGASRVVSGTARSVFGRANVEVEAAKSDSVKLGGAAGLIRVYGDAPSFQYDFGAQQATDAFAGAQRATSDQHVTLSGQRLGPATLSAMLAMHTMNPTVASNGFGQKMATSTLSASFMNGSAIEYDRFDRNDFGTTTALRGTQQSIRTRARLVVGALDMLASVQTGIVSQDDSASRGFTTMSGSVRARLGRDQFVSAFADVTDGKALGAGGIGTMTGGTTAEIKLGELTTIRATTTVTTQRDRLSDWAGQADFTVERRIRQSIVALRGRIAESGSGATPSSNAFYMEVRTPLRLPTSRLDLGGRARARVVDAETGKGVQGALVRMGEVAAVTDRNGIATFKGLEIGDYHAVVEGGIAAGRLVNGGSVNVGPGRPAAFELNVSRGARVQAHLRRMERVHGGSGSTPNPGADSLVDVGGVGQAVLALISARDTIWQSSDDRGRVDFGAIIPGRYTVRVVAGDVPEFTAFEKKEVEIEVAAGETRDIELRLVPQIRAVQFIGEETVLIAVPKSKASPNAAPRQQQRQQDRKQQ
ncbi:MAG TPA: hypothetical protein VFO55_08755 [Gemmatimonadaceae bacterium]|nr:hypothetical protein [Gemmatimonadaceae bacterium]